MNQFFGPQFGLTVVPNTRAPSNKSRFKEEDEKREAEEKKKLAMDELVKIHQQLRRQIGKPELAQTALLPFYPNI